MRFNAFLIVLSVATPALSAKIDNPSPAVPLFGLPLGGLIGMVAICPPDTDKSKVPCWVDLPYKHRDGSRSGMIHLPNSDGRPKWAAHAMFNAEVSKNGTLGKIVAKTFGSDDFANIQESISKRFGRPTEGPYLSATTYSAKWIRRDISIRMLCGLGDFCTIDSASPAWWASLQAEVEDRKKTDAARPASP